MSKGWLLALEFESVNDVLKMGVYIFVGILSVRIAINQTLRRISIKENQTSFYYC